MTCLKIKKLKLNFSGLILPRDFEIHYFCDLKEFIANLIFLYESTCDTLVVKIRATKLLPLACSKGEEMSLSKPTHSLTHPIAI